VLDRARRGASCRQRSENWPNESRKVTKSSASRSRFQLSEARPSLRREPSRLPTLERHDSVEVRHATLADADGLARLRHALWPDGSEADHRRDVERFFANPQTGAILVMDDRSGLVGFADLSIRSYAEGCESGRVGFLEGWYVVPEARRRGIGRRLVTAGEEWARSAGCVEFGSDAEAGNELGTAAHRALGFEEVGLIRCFRKDL
jgi:aminoglycoside 6'-N-acetyltransferase I